MKLINEIKVFFINAGYDKLFLCVFPALFALTLAGNTFLFNIKSAVIFIAAAACFQLSVQLFDDLLDWIFGKTTLRKELEQTGIRGLYTKCSYFLNDKKSPRLYFYLSVLLFVLAEILVASINIYISLLTLIIFALFGLINYYPKFRKIPETIGTESLSALLSAPVCMMLLYLAAAKCITIYIIFAGIILFFAALNVCYTASILNLKSDILTQKTTLPVKIENSNFRILLSFILNILPYLLVPVAVYMKILPRLSLISLTLLGHSLWLFYLVYMFEKEPQKQVKWHFLMGEDENKILNEQKNISWYMVRYNLARNIFVTFIIVLMLSDIKWSDLFF